MRAVLCAGPVLCVHWSISPWLSLTSPCRFGFGCEWNCAFVQSGHLENKAALEGRSHSCRNSFDSKKAPQRALISL